MEKDLSSEKERQIRFRFKDLEEDYFRLKRDPKAPTFFFLFWLSIKKAREEEEEKDNLMRREP